MKIRQTSDVSAGKGAVRGVLLGAALSIVAGPLGAMAAAGVAGGTAIAGLGDKGVDDKLALAGEGLDEAGLHEEADERRELRAAGGDLNDVLAGGRRGLRGGRGWDGHGTGSEGGEPCSYLIRRCRRRL